MGIFSKKSDDKITSKNAMAKANAESQSRSTAPVATVWLNAGDDHSWLTIKTANSARLNDKPFDNPSLLNVTGSSAKYFMSDAETSLGFQEIKGSKGKGKVVEPDYSDSANITKSYSLNEAQFKAMFMYINDKREHHYSKLGYNSATFATHALKAAGLAVPNAMTLGGLTKELEKERDQIQKTNEKREKTNQTLVANPFEQLDSDKAATKRVLSLHEAKDSILEQASNLKATSPEAEKIAFLKAIVVGRGSTYKWDDISKSINALKTKGVFMVSQCEAIKTLYTQLSNDATGRRGHAFEGLGIQPDVRIISPKLAETFCDYIDTLRCISGNKLDIFISSEDMVTAANAIADSLLNESSKLSPEEVRQIVTIFKLNLSAYPEFLNTLKERYQTDSQSLPSETVIDQKDEQTYRKYAKVAEKKGSQFFDNIHQYTGFLSVRADRDEAALKVLNS